MWTIAKSLRMNGYKIKIGIILTSLLFYLSITNIMSIDKNKLDTHAARAGTHINIGIEPGYEKFQ